MAKTKPKRVNKKTAASQTPDPNRLITEKRWKLCSFARRWLRSPNMGEDPWGEEEVEACGHDWEEWFPRQAAQGKLLNMGGVWVDRYLLNARFQCVPERCMPRPGRGRYKCCCADLDCVVSHSEAHRLRQHTKRLWPWLVDRERRLIQHCHPPGEGDGPFWLDEDGENLERPDDRCVFSKIDREGRILCHLFEYAEDAAVRRREVQPLPCRLFPLVLLDMEDGRLGLTVMGPHNYKYVPTWHPRHFPCLDDPELPYLTESSGRDLDFLFGEGFAAELERLREAGEGLSHPAPRKRAKPKPKSNSKSNSADKRKKSGGARAR